MSLLSIGLCVLAPLGACPPADRPPPGPPPRPMYGRLHPPPAWVSIGARRVWLSTGSFCWMDGRRGICVDGRLPRRPVLRVAPGEQLRFHLRFTPRMAHLSAPGFQGRLPAFRTIGWTVPERTGRGTLSLLVRARSGSASYGGTLVVR